MLEEDICEGRLGRVFDEWLIQYEAWHAAARISLTQT